MGYIISVYSKYFFCDQVIFENINPTMPTELQVSPAQRRCSGVELWRDSYL